MEIRTASGGTLTASMALMLDRISEQRAPIFVVTFESEEPATPEHVWRASLVAWVPAEEKSDVAVVRRRAVRSLIPFGLTIADAIVHLSLSPTIQPRPPPSTGVEFSYSSHSSPGGLLRAADVRTHIEQATIGPRIDKSLSEQASHALRKLTRELHGSVALTENVAVFGK